MIHLSHHFCCQILDLYMDDVRIELPSIESVVVLNIPFWGGGVKPWDLGTGHSQYRPQSYDDGLLEVFCVFSSFHIAQMQVSSARSKLMLYCPSAINNLSSKF